MEMPVPQICPVCHQSVSADAYFCPNCGHELRPKPPSTTWWSQLGLYALSALLPPLGLWPAWKYLKSSDEAAERVGWIAVAFTAVSLIVSIWLFQYLMQQLNQSLNASTGGLLGSGY